MIVTTVRPSWKHPSATQTRTSAHVGPAIVDTTCRMTGIWLALTDSERHAWPVLAGASRRRYLSLRARLALLATAPSTLEPREKSTVSRCAPMELGAIPGSRLCNSATPFHLDIALYLHIARPLLTCMRCQPCTACPLGTFQPAVGRTSCLECPFGSNTTGLRSTSEVCPK